jgi:tetrapyrrole methylase family protein/MazG family protein
MPDRPGIILLGLGPGEVGLLTRQAAEILEQAEEIYLRTRQHPTVAHLPGRLSMHSFDELYETAETFDDLYQEIVRQVLALGQRPQGVIYAVPGHPLIAEATGPEILRQAGQLGLPVRVVAGLSFLEPVVSALEEDPFPQMALVDALELAASHYPGFPADFPALIAQLYSRQVASDVKLTLMAAYPDKHPVRLVHAAGTEHQIVEDLPLYEIDRSQHIDLLTCLYVPPLVKGSSVETFNNIVAHLRAPDGCPWDQKQTLASLRPHLLEEAYEVLTAIDQDDPQALREELGDLLLMILMLSQIASEEGAFRLPEVVADIHHKIVRRHPHVFGDLNIPDEEGVLVNWEKLKERERAANGEHKGLLDGVALALPALQQALEIQGRAARVGFDWSETESVWGKVDEEIAELRAATDNGEQEAELGDLLFAITNLARHLGVDPEAALRGTNNRFRRRFQHIERQAQNQNRAVSELSLEEMDRFWEEAKALIE